MLVFCSPCVQTHEHDIDLHGNSDWLVAFEASMCMERAMCKQAHGELERLPSRHEDSHVFEPEQGELASMHQYMSGAAIRLRAHILSSIYP